MDRKYSYDELYQYVELLEAKIRRRDHTEAKLKKSAQRLRLIIEATENGIWDWDLRTDKIYFSRRCCSMLDYKKDDFPTTYKGWLQLVHPDDVNANEKKLRHALEDQVPFAFRFRAKSRNGKWRWVLSRGNVVEWDCNGRAIRAAGTHSEITEQKTAEDALKVSAERYRIMTSTSMDGFNVVDAVTGKILDANEACSRMNGYNRDELLNMSTSDIEAADTQADISERLEKIKTGPLRFETRHRRKDGRIIDVEINATYLPSSSHVLAFTRDITEHKQARRALLHRVHTLTQPMVGAEDEICFEDLFDLSKFQHLQDLFSETFGVYALLTRPDNTPITQPSNLTEFCEIVRCKPKALERCIRFDALLGRHHPAGPHLLPCQSAGLLGAGVSITVGGRHVANWRIGQVRDRRQSEKDILAFAYEIDADEKTVLDAYRKLTILSKEQFEIIARVLFELADLISTSAYQNFQQARFIADLKRADEALYKYERIVSVSQDIIALINSDFTYEAVNDSFLKSYNKLRTEVVGHTVAQVMGAEVFRKMLKPLLDRAFMGHTIHHRDTFDISAAGSRVMEVTLSPMVNDDGRVEAVVLNARDVTETRKLEERLIHSQKIESIGTLAGGVAHEINNPINGIMNYAQLIMDRMQEGDPNQEFVQEILHETQRISEIVRNLLKFSRDEKQTFSPARMSSIVGAVLSLIQTVLRHDQIELHVEVPYDLPEIMCRSQQIQQVLMNLMTNARDALNERYPGYSHRKQVYITAALVEKQNRKLIRTSIKDYGTGIPSEISKRIFDPFYTTKPKKVGTGLGLSISYRIVKEHHGELSVQSKQGHYTCFNMDLPVNME